MFSFIKRIGELGPIILFATSIFFLRNKYSYLFYYVVFFIISLILNLVLKSWIQEPRPSINPKIFQQMIKSKDRFITKHGMPYDIFGLPSGHSQSVIYSTFYVFYCLQDYKVLIFYLIISLITLFQRVIDNHHTIKQILVGSLIGLILAIIGYKLAKSNIEGKKTRKKEDYGPM